MGPRVREDDSWACQRNTPSSTGNPVIIGRVDSAADCSGVSDGWYYDDPVAPMKIFVCPQTCTTIQAADSATVNIQFGCATIPAG